MSTDTFDPTEAMAQPLDPEEAEGLKAKALRTGLSGLGYVGSTLDKMFGGRAARALVDTLAGSGQHARDILSIIPFSETLGLTSPEQAVSGSQLVKNVTGIDPEAQRGYTGAWAMRNLVGPAAEIALDPSMYLGGIGALTKAGKAAEMAGKEVPGILSKGFLESVKSGERTLMHGLTGRAPAAAMEGLGDIAGGANLAARRAMPALGRGEDWLARQMAENVGPTARAVFDPNSIWVPERNIQEAFAATRPQRQALEKGWRGRFFGARGTENRLIQEAIARGEDPRAYRDQLRRVLNQAGEGVDPTFMNEADQAFLQAAPQQFKDLVEHVRTQGATAPLELERQAGIGTKEFEDKYADYLMAQRHPALQEQRSLWDLATGFGKAKALPTTHEALKQRSDIFRNIPGGRVAINDLIQEHAGKSADEILPYLQHIGTSPVGFDEAGTVVRQAIQDAELQRQGLAKFISGVDKTKLDRAGGRYFMEDPIAAAAMRSQMAGHAAVNADTIIGALGRTARHAPLEGGQSVLDALKGAGLATDVGMQRAAEAIGLEPHHLTEYLTRTGITDPARALPGVLGERYIPKRVAEGLGALSRGQPAVETGVLGELMRKSLSAFKVGAYTVWPNSQVRNFYSGRYAALAESGTHPLSRGYTVARESLKNPGSEIATGINHLPTSRDLLRSAYERRVIGGDMSEIAASLPEGVRPSEFLADPSAARSGLHQAFGDFFHQITQGSWRNPFATTPGAEGAAVKLGHSLNTVVEDNLRLGQYTDLLQRGWSEDAAAKQVMKTHFDYERGIAPAERRFLNKWATFPTYTRLNVPKQIGQAVTHPARISGPIRFSGATETGEGYVPQYMQSGLAIPLPMPGLPEGTQAYLARLGLPFEEAFGHLKTAPTAIGTVKETAQDFLSMLRPDIKAALEWATGRQLHTGRELSQLEPGEFASMHGMLDVDTTTALAQLLSGTPISRLHSTLNRWLDQRRMNAPGLADNIINQLTGIKTTAVDVEKWRAIDQKRALEELMGRSRAIRETSDYYIPAERLPKATEEDIRNIQLAKVLEKERRQRRKEKEMEGL